MWVHQRTLFTIEVHHFLCFHSYQKAGCLPTCLVAVNCSQSVTGKSLMETPAVCKDKKPFCHASQVASSTALFRVLSRKSIPSILKADGKGFFRQVVSSCGLSAAGAWVCLQLVENIKKVRCKITYIQLISSSATISFIIDLGGPILCIFLYPIFQFHQAFWWNMLL